MFEVIRYILETDQDIKLYYNQENLVRELICQDFTLEEITEAIDWFCPIIDASGHQSYYYTASSVRGFDYLENKYLSKNIINKILGQEKNGIINPFVRDVLIDRIALIARTDTDESELEQLLDNLIFHVSNYKFGLINQETQTIPTAWNTNFTLH